MQRRLAPSSGWNIPHRLGLQWTGPGARVAAAVVRGWFIPREVKDGVQLFGLEAGFSRRFRVPITLFIRSHFPLLIHTQTARHLSPGIAVPARRRSRSRSRSRSRGRRAVAQTGVSCDGSISSFQVPPARSSTESGRDYSETFELGPDALLELSMPAQPSDSYATAVTEVATGSTNMYSSASLDAAGPTTDW